jgi:hypothetical protein
MKPRRPSDKMAANARKNVNSPWRKGPHIRYAQNIELHETNNARKAEGKPPLAKGETE